ncbi:hypothetical protein SLS62_007512 [Diatrype stigma]|uniref:Uncharacterized protein n=1 Tax=Diatrype stigma TaxID=117547 RepID=A0AAN9UMJ9_9PEZI
MSMSTSSISSGGGSSRPTSRNYDTGFPEWFAAHTTSLRHPDAITTPGACISAEDLDPSKALRRGKRSLMAKHKRTLSHGKIAPEPNQNQQHLKTSVVLDHAHEAGGQGPADGGKFESQSPTTTDGSGSEVADWDPDVPIDSTEHSDDDTKSRRNSNNLFKRWRSHHH